MNKQKTKKPKKQRKKKAKLPLHKRQNQMSATLKPKLREKHGRRNLPIRKKDKVQIMRGDQKGRTGEVKKIHLNSYKVEIEDVETQTQDGEPVNIKFNPSNLMITSLNLEDERRKQKITTEGEQND